MNLTLVKGSGGSDAGNEKRSTFETRAEITAFIELRALADELNKVIVARRQASREQIEPYTIEERAQMSPEMQVLHRGLFLSLEKLAGLEEYVSSTVRRCNDEIDSLHDSLMRGGLG